MTIIVSGTTVFNLSAQIDWARFNDIVYNYSTGNLTYIISTDCNCACACSTDSSGD